MTWLQAILKEVLDLFVDDRALVLAVLSALIAAGLIVLWTGSSPLAGAVLVGWLVIALAGSVWRGTPPGE